MNAAAREADRAAEVRTAARGWRDAGAVSAEANAAIVAKYPDDRVRSGIALRILLNVVTFIAAAAFVGFFAAAGAEHYAPVFFLAAVLCAGVVEVAVTAGKWSGRGPEEAAAAWAVLGTAIAVAGSFPGGGDERWMWTASLFACCAVSAFAAWRWAMPFFGATCAGGLLLAVARVLPAGRLAIAVLAPAAAWAAWRGTRTSALAPSQRRGCAWALGAAVVVFGFAVNPAVIDAGWSDPVLGLRVLSAAHADPGTLARLAASAATALLPVVLLALGVRLRDRLLLWLGALAVATGCVTIRYYVHGVPLWLVLLGAGAAVIAIAAALQRWIDSGSGRERGGFTVRDLLPEKSREFLVQAATAMAATSATPAGPEKVAAESKFGGGDFGGGGASGGY